MQQNSTEFVGSGDALGVHVRDLVEGEDIASDYMEAPESIEPIVHVLRSKEWRDFQAGHSVDSTMLMKKVYDKVKEKEAEQRQRSKGDEGNNAIHVQGEFCGGLFAARLRTDENDRLHVEYLLYELDETKFEFGFDLHEGENCLQYTKSEEGTTWFVPAAIKDRVEGSPGVIACFNARRICSYVKIDNMRVIIVHGAEGSSYKRERLKSICLGTGSFTKFEGSYGTETIAWSTFPPAWQEGADILSTFMERHNSMNIETAPVFTACLEELYFCLRLNGLVGSQTWAGSCNNEFVREIQATNGYRYHYARNMHGLTRAYKAVAKNGTVFKRDNRAGGWYRCYKEKSVVRHEVYWEDPEQVRLRQQLIDLEEGHNKNKKKKKDESKKTNHSLPNTLELDAPIVSECGICFERVQIFAFKDCGHAVYCKECICLHVKVVSRTCPSCCKPLSAGEPWVQLRKSNMHDFILQCLDGSDDQSDDEPYPSIDTAWSTSNPLEESSSCSSSPSIKKEKKKKKKKKKGTRRRNEAAAPPECQEVASKEITPSPGKRGDEDKELLTQAIVDLAKAQEADDISRSYTLNTPVVVTRCAIIRIHLECEDDDDFYEFHIDNRPCSSDGNHILTITKGK